MLVGPAVPAVATALDARLTAQPSIFIAQPTFALSTCPTGVESEIALSHGDCRPDGAKNAGLAAR